MYIVSDSGGRSGRKSDKKNLLEVFPSTVVVYRYGSHNTRRVLGRRIRSPKEIIIKYVANTCSTGFVLYKFLRFGVSYQKKKKIRLLWYSFVYKKQHCDTLLMIVILSTRRLYYILSYHGEMSCRPLNQPFVPPPILVRKFGVQNTNTTYESHDEGCKLYFGVSKGGFGKKSCQNSNFRTGKKKFKSNKIWRVHFFSKMWLLWRPVQLNVYAFGLRFFWFEFWKMACKFKRVA